MTAPSVPLSMPAPRRLPAALWLIPLLLIVGAVAFWQFRPGGSSGTRRVDGQFVTLGLMDLDIKIVKDGELQAVDFVDIKSDVEGNTQVLEVVPEGTNVRKGDILCTLDSSQLQLRREDLANAVIKAESAVKIAREVRDIQESQNATNKEAAEISVELAGIQLRQYEEGTYPQQLQNARTALEMARTNLRTRQDVFNQTQALYDRGFVTGADIQRAELDVINSRNEVAKAETALRVLEEYQHLLDLTQLRSSQAQARQRLARVIRENQSLMMQRNADVQEKEQTLLDLQRRLKKVEDQIAACTIKAPEDGLVIYASTVDNQREPLQDGSTVRQYQWLFRLPNVRRMKAVITLNEIQKVKVDGDRQLRAMVWIIGNPRPIGATVTRVSVLPDNRMRFQNPDRRDYPCELVLDETPAGLKPGTKVERVEILLESFPQSLAVPLTAVYSVGTEAFAFVRDGSFVRERRLTLGAANESHVQVLTGLEPGEQVLLLQPGQGKTLLEQLGVKVAESTPRRSGEPGATPRRPGDGPGGGRMGRGGPPSGT
jgi:HlyD family secretion protein